MKLWREEQRSHVPLDRKKGKKPRTENKVNMLDAIHKNELSERASNRVSAAERASEASRAEQANESAERTSERTNEWASGPVLRSLFLFVPDHSALEGDDDDVVKKRNECRKRRKRHPFSDSSMKTFAFVGAGFPLSGVMLHIMTGGAKVSPPLAWQTTNNELLKY